ncbi:MAG: hypothetical protein V1659_04450 [Candidatus Woesearchaeota archaeon]
MEQYQACAQEAKNLVKVADHMLIITYPLIKDPKLLLTIAQKLFSALENSMSSLLYLERTFKRIGPFGDNFDSKFNIFRNELVRRFNIRKDFIMLIQELREIVLEHEKSPVEFRRKDSFVICSDSYKVRSLSFEAMKKYVARAKEFIYELELLVSKNDRILK